MDPNPYAPPKAPVADVVAPSNLLKRRRVIVMIGFTLITFGLYYPVWFFRRRAALNSLDSPRKLQLWPLLLFAALFVVDFVVALVSGDMPPEVVIGSGPVALLALARLAIGIVMIVQCFTIKAMLEDHLEGPDEERSHMFSFDRVKLSGLMTFFFQIYYLQHIINRHIVDAEKKPIEMVGSPLAKSS